MNIFQNIAKRMSTLANPDQYLKDYFSGGISSATGVSVNEKTSLNLSVVYACVRVISESIASLPFIVYERVERGKKRSTNHYLYDILHNQPNPDMSAFTYKELMVAQLLLWGNHYSQKIYGLDGRLKYLYPLLPEKMRVERKNGVNIYIYTTEKEEVVLSPYEVFHIPGFGFDGLVGKSVISMARESIGLGLALEEFGARYFSNNTHVGAVVEHPRKLDSTSYDNLKSALNEKYTGLGKTHKLLILEDGLKYTKTAVQANDAQFIESRRFQIEEIAGRIFRVQLHLIGELSHATFSNIEHQGIEFVTYTLMPWLKRIEQAVQIDLFDYSNRQTYFAEHLVNSLLRGDIQTRYNAYAQARQNGWMSANDIRELENMNPIEAGDIYLVPLNMVDAKDVGQNSNRSSIGYDAANKRFINLDSTQMYEANLDETREVPVMQKSLSETIETRSKRGAVSRLKIAQSFNPLITDAVNRILKSERSDIIKAAKSIFNSRDSRDLNEFLNQYYEENAEYIRKRTRPVMQSLGELISAAAAKEIKFDGDISANLQRFMDSHNELFAKGYSTISKATLRKAVEQATMNETDPLEVLNAQFDKWEESRPDSEAKRESIMIAGAASLLTFQLGGMSKLIWVNTGSRSCPFCENMDGKTVSISEPFFHKGDVHNPEGAEKPLDLGFDVRQPPLHDTCICSLAAG
jgi:HK97 family phage portal protein